MKKISVLLLTLVLATSSSAMAAVLDFEDLYTGTEGFYYPIPSPYHGFTMSDYCGFITKYYLPGSGYEVGTSGHGSMFNAYAYDISLSMPMTFSVQTLDVTSAWNSSQTAYIYGLLSGSMIYTYTLNLTNTAVSLITLNWTGIDELYFSSGTGYQLCIDNIVYNASVAPLPGSLLLVGTGLVGLIGRRFWS